jgi:hypothetical protein
MVDCGPIRAIASLTVRTGAKRMVRMRNQFASAAAAALAAETAWMPLPGTSGYLREGIHAVRRGTFRTSAARGQVAGIRLYAGLE